MLKYTINNNNGFVFTQFNEHMSMIVNFFIILISSEYNAICF